MSGAEAGLVLGLISSVITICETAYGIWEVAEGQRGLPKRLQRAAQELPLVAASFEQAKGNLQTALRAGTISDETRVAVEQVLHDCEESAGFVKQTLEDCLPAAGDERTQKYKKAYNLSRKSGKIEERIQRMFQGIETLVQHQLLVDADILEDIRQAVEALSVIDKDDGVSQVMHGNGDNIQQSGSGIIRKYHNSGVAPMYNAENMTQHFAKVDTQHIHLAGNTACIYDISFFKTSPYVSFKNDPNPDRKLNTCAWFLEHEAFLQWSSSGHTNLLCLSADPGVGKSVLAKTLIDEVLPAWTSWSTIYFFFRDNSVQEDVCVALCALLHQLFDKRNHLFERHAPKFIKAHGTELKSDFEALWELFEQVIADPDMGNVVCLLDALDECATKYRQSLISKIERLLSTRGADDFPPKPDLKFLLATRPYASVTGSFSRLSVGDVSSLLDGTKEQHRISGEIDEVIKAELGAYGRSLCLTVEQIRSATSTLLEYRNRTYLWVKFILEEIRLANPATPSEFADVVSRLPRSVEDAYEKMLSRCQNRGRAIAILAILLAARRAFSLEEIDVLLALHVEPKPASYNDLQHNLAGPNVRAAQVREQCGLFVVVVDCKLHLIHQTAYEFLLRSHSAPRPDEGWKHLLHAPETHEFLCGACIWFLLFPEFTLSRLDLASDRPVLTSKVEQILNQNGDTFLRYACTYWATHFIESRSKAFDPLTEWARTLYHPPEGRTRIWHHIYSRFQTSRRKSSCDSDPGLQPGTPFELICCYGHCAVLKLIGTSSATMTLLQRGLYHASRNGHVDVVNWLLQAGANVNATINDGPTPLQAAARLGRYRVSKALLANGADMGHPGGPTGWGSALHIALREGNVQLATTMLRQSPDVCAASAKYRSALHAAAGCLRHGSGHLEIFRQCMELGIDVNCHDSDRNTALHLLAELGGQPEKVEQLLASGADLSMVNAQGQTPLCIVVARLYLEQVLSTIDNEDPNSSKASKRSRTEIPLKAADTIRLVSCHFTTLLPSILAQLRTDVMATEASILQVYNELALSLRPSAEFNRPRSWDVAARLGLFQLVKFWPSLEVESDEAAATAVIKFDDVPMTEFPAIVAFCSDEMECNICHAKNMLSGGHCPFCRRSGLYICENCIAHDGGCPEGHVLRSYRLELAPKELLDLLLTDEGEQYFRTSAKMSSDTLKYWGHDSVN